VRRVLPGMSGVTINAGVGHGRYSGDDGTPYPPRASGGLVGSVGIGVRVPASSRAAFSVAASYIAAFAGERETGWSTRGVVPFRPRTLLVTTSFSLAARGPRGD
jgi:hypothetical protein